MNFGRVPSCVFALTLLVGSAAAIAAPAPKSPPTPLLWSVSKGSTTVYLLGSFHLLRADDYPVSAAVESAFADAETVVFEVPPEQLDSPEAAMLAGTLARYDNGGSLSSALSARQRAALEDALKHQGVSLAQLDAFEPWFVNLMLVIGLSDSMGFHAQQGLDRYLIARATEAGKKTGGLETVQSQLEALDRTPASEQVESLGEFLKSPAEARAQLEAMHRAWRRGDVDALDELTRAQMERDTPATYRALDVARNNAWMPQIVAMTRAPNGDDALVVVGAVHLLGKDGLVAQLRSRGFDVQRVRVPRAK